MKSKKFIYLIGIIALSFLCSCGMLFRQKTVIRNCEGKTRKFADKKFKKANTRDIFLDRQNEQWLKKRESKEKPVKQGKGFKRKK